MRYVFVLYVLILVIRQNIKQMPTHRKQSAMSRQQQRAAYLASGYQFEDTDIKIQTHF
jgi:hypothetical protein